MTEKLKETPLWVGAGAALPPSLSLKKRLSRVDRYDEPYSLWEERGGELLVPRNMVEFGPDTEDRRVEYKSSDFASSFKPRGEDQAHAVEKSVRYLKKGRNHVLSAPTGKGKTAMAMEIIAQISQPTLVIVHKADLYDNWLEDAKKFLGLDPDEIGVIQGDNVRIRKLTLGMVQSLMKPNRYPRSAYEAFGFVIVDEVHRIGAEKFSGAMWNLPGKYRLGLSATPDRKDGRMDVIEGHIGPVAVKISKADLTPKVVVVSTPWKSPVVRKKGRWVKFPYRAGRTMGANKSMAEDMNRVDMIAHLIKLAHEKERKVLFLTDLLVHIDLVRQSLTKQVPQAKIGVYVGGLSKTERALAACRPVILSTFKMASEGTNIPAMDTCILGTPRSDVRQVVGRILRLHDGKKSPVVIDLLDSDHGLFVQYYRSREKWYRSIGAKIVFAGVGNG